MATGSTSERTGTEASAVSKKTQEALLRATPEGILGWNRYIDRFVVGFVLALVFIACIRPITQSGIWGLLRSGDSILAGGPVNSDTLSFSQSGQRWVNIPWLFEVANSSLYHTVSGLFQSPDYPDRGAFAGASALVLINALLVTLAAALILTIRRKGPGLWWLAVCVLLALGGIFVPSGQGFQPSVGGIAIGKNAVDPESWGLVFLALELVILFRASELGRGRLLWGLPVLFAVWANIAPNFAFGLLILAGWAAGQTISVAMARTSVSPFLPLGILGASALACLVNPSTLWIFQTAFKPFGDILPRWFGQATSLISDDVGFFDRLSREYFDRTGGPGTSNAFLLFYVLTILGVFASFALNWRRFSLARFLMFIVAALVWAGLVRTAPPFALVFAAVLGLNGQEWFQDTFGTAGHASAKWKLFSDGGRALTILATCAFIAMAVTGYKSVEGDTFGLGYDDSKLAFETADFLRDSGIQGNVLGLTRSIGDAQLWRDPKHQSYLDNRHGLFTSAQQAELESLRIALRDGDKATWSKILDGYERDARPISAVVVPQEFGAIYRSLMNSADWLPIHDGGNAIVFGRADIAELPDLAQFKSAQLDPEILVFRSTTSISSPERPPTASTWMDGILQYRALRPPQPRINSGGRWLTNPANPEAPLDPARCLLAIRDARLALVKNPDDSSAYELLSQAYGVLTLLENQILTSTAKTGTTVPRTFSNFRYRQRVSALNFAIVTSAPPNTPQSNIRLGNLHREIAGLYDNNNALDLERTHLEAARKLMGSTFPEVLEQQLTRLDEQYAQFQDQLSDYAAANSAGPVQQANLASQSGYPATAIQYFKDAENAGFSMAQLRFALVDLYCQTGQPNEAFDLLEGTTANDESLGVDGATPGLKLARAGYRNGLVHLLLGNYSMTTRYWNNYTLPFIRAAETEQTLNAAREMLNGQAIPALRSIMEVAGTPEQPGLIDTYAEWQAELGFCQLESGAALDTRDANGAVLQEGAATHFRRALEIKPQTPLRPLLAYYLEKMGQEVPAAPVDEPAPAVVPATTAPTTHEPQPEVPAAEVKPAEPATPAPDAKPTEEPAAPAPTEAKPEQPEPAVPAPADAKPAEGDPAPAEVKPVPETPAPAEPKPAEVSPAPSL